MPQHTVYFQSLLIPYKRHNAESRGLALVVLCILRLLNGGTNQRRNDFGLHLIHVVPTLVSALNSVVNNVRIERNRRCLAQRFDFAFVGEIVAERDDVRRTPEVFGQPNHSAKGNLC